MTHSPLESELTVDVYWAAGAVLHLGFPLAGTQPPGSMTSEESQLGNWIFLYKGNALVCSDGEQSCFPNSVANSAVTDSKQISCVGTFWKVSAGHP